MSNHQTFIGAYARNRPGRKVSDETTRHSAAEPVAASSQRPQAVPPQAVPPQAVLPQAVPPHHLPPASSSQPAETEAAADSNALAELPEDMFSHSVLVSNSYPEAAGIWIGQDEGQVLRIDAPQPSEPEPAVASPQQPAELSSGEIAGKEIEPVAPVPIPTPEVVSEPEAGTEPEMVTAPEMLTEPEVAVDPESVVAARFQRLVQQPKERAERQPPWAGADWEVDAFQLPHSVVDLFFDEALFRSIAEQMGRSVESGLRSVLVTSVGPREGRTTVSIGTAIAAAATGIRVAIVDADLESPRTAEYLRLDIQSDWVTAIRHGGRLESISVRSLEDGVTLIPLLDSSEDSMLATSQELDLLLDHLAGCFDLVLFDASPLDSWSTARIASSVDATLIVRDARATSKADVALAADRLHRLGVTGVGVIDNFCG